MVERLYTDDFAYVLNRGTGDNVKTFCPFCRDRRSDKHDKSLSINRRTLQYNCHYCGASGVLISKLEETRREMEKMNWQPRTYKKPPTKPNIQPTVDPDIVEWFKTRGISEKTS